MDQAQELMGIARELGRDRFLPRASAFDRAGEFPTAVACFRDGCVHQVFDFSACESWRHLAQLFGIDVVGTSYFVQI